MSTPTPKAFETACGPLGPGGHSLTEKKYALRWIQHRPTPPKSVSGRGGNSVFGGFAAIFAKLEFAGLLNWEHFAAKRPGYNSL
jgi:hypothetical protein